MALYNVYILGHWINEILYLGGTRQVITLERVKKYVSEEYGTSMDFITVSFARMDQERA
jgi:hypothetical protein